MSGASMDNLLVILETASGELTRGSLEALVCAQQLAPKRLSAVLLGGDDMIVPPALASVRLDEVRVLHHALLKDYSADAWVEALRRP